jgi:hypothetical protein
MGRMHRVRILPGSPKHAMQSIARRAPQDDGSGMWVPDMNSKMPGLAGHFYDRNTGNEAPPHAWQLKIDNRRRTTY